MLRINMPALLVDMGAMESDLNEMASFFRGGAT
jgi:hypothetical protein